MSTQPTTWCWSTDEEIYHGPCDSVAQACTDAKNSIEGGSFYDFGDEVEFWVAEVAEATDFLHADRIGDWVLEHLDEVLADEIPADGPLVTLTPEQQKELGQIIIDFARAKDGFKRFGVKNVQMKTHTFGGAT